jgi:lipopolysaccharide export system permease protein
VAVTAIRLIGFACSVLSQRYAAAVFAHYLVLFGAAALGLHAISRGLVIEPPAFATNFANAILSRLPRRNMAT